MLYVNKIKMISGCDNSFKQEEIDQLHLIGNTINPGWLKKEDVHDFIKNKNGIVKVGTYPYPELIPAISPKGEKYVKSVADNTQRDNLMYLPRCY